jgi:tetratricopeptide (TPR) repeat protein
LESYDNMRKLSEALARESPTDQDAQHSLAMVYEKIGKVLLGTRDFVGALAQFRRELTALQNLASANSANSQFLRDVSVAYGNLGDALSRKGDLVEALVNYNQMLAIRERLAAADPTNVGAQGDLARGLSAAVRAAAKTTRTGDIRRYQLRLLAIEKQLAERPAATANDLNAYAWDLLTCALADLRNPVLARQYAERAVLMTNRKDGNILDTLALALHVTGDEAGAAQTEERAISLSPANFTDRQDFETRLRQYRAASNRQK